ncbi:MAG: hypothetical protein QMD21_00335 [Candidatus Thermoplasmatota archaeon]|nr:hypothetical protein [Candidatus Thermoplasmatota archaeon]MDI6855218.1 hypothetical protein [Candidatus Thermoplasmatota archaeon]
MRIFKPFYRLLKAMTEQKELTESFYELKVEDIVDKRFWIKY